MIAIGHRIPDVLVVGAGIVGASIAWRLAQQELRVVLVDAGTFGGESSAAGAGMLSPGGEVVAESRWAYLTVESRRLYPAFVEELQQDTGLEIDFRPCGALELALGEAERMALAERAARQAAIGIASEEVSHADALRQVPGLAHDSFTHARWFPGDGVVDPRGVTQALRIALERSGAEIHEHQPVTRLDVELGVAWTNDDGREREWNAGAIVVAAGAWSGALSPVLPPSAPVKGHLIGFYCKPGTLGPIVRRGHTYLLQRSNGFTIAGATMERVGFDRSINPEAVAMLHREARRYLPGLYSGELAEAWIGFRPAADGPEPVVRRVPETDVWLAYGHLRNGILLAPVTAKMVTADLVSSQFL